MSDRKFNIKDLIQPGELKFALYFSYQFVGYEKWTERGWMYSQDDITYTFEAKYAYNQKLILTPKT